MRAISGGCQVYVFDNEHGTEAEVRVKIYIYIYNFNITAFVGLCEFFINARTRMTFKI